MRLLTFMIAGAALAAGIVYITREREDGTSILDELTEKAPKWYEKGRQFATQTIDNVTEEVKKRNYR
ncbi:MAG TPA: YtxH domain-containing protein [Mucilaginibacter sp.]|nr:YtxH domain-containing protein [Mucilaginibacter sp.]